MQSTGGPWAIDLMNVAKVYRKGQVHALQGIEMRVRRGEVFGLLGQNGAGKSTLVKIMLTVIRPTRADGTLLGEPIGNKATLQRIGYLPENHRFPKYLTGRQTLEFFAAMSKVDRPTRKRRASELLEVVGMGEWADTKTASYSKGMMQRIGLAQALVADPDLIVLDEPTDGVDPVGRRDIRDVLLRLREQGKTVFINSHLLSELEMICDRVSILVKGRVARQGTIDELTRARQRYEIELAPGEDPGRLREQVRSALPQALTEMGAPFAQAAPIAGALLIAGVRPVAGALPIAGVASPLSPPALPGRPPPIRAAALTIDRGMLPGGVWIEFDGLTLRIGTTDAAAIQPVLDALRRAGLILRRVIPFRQSLEDLFMEAVTDPVTGQAMTPGADHRRGLAMTTPPMAIAQGEPR